VRDVPAQLLVERVGAHRLVSSVVVVVAWSASSCSRHASWRASLGRSGQTVSAARVVGDHGPVIGEHDPDELEALPSEVKLALAGLDRRVRQEAVRIAAHRWLAASASWA
jgi:hypothetical protein